MLELFKFQEVNREEGNMVEEEDKAHDKLNLARIGKNGEPIIKQDLKLFILSEYINFRVLNEIIDETNFEINLEFPQADMTECYKDDDRSSFVSNNLEIRDKL